MLKDGLFENTLKTYKNRDKFSANYAETGSPQIIPVVG